ncbi:unnamed protein product [Leuciscus chuanchicus]
MLLSGHWGDTDLEVAWWMLFGEHPVSCFDIFLVAPIKLSLFLQEMKRGLMDLSWDRMIKAHRKHLLSPLSAFIFIALLLLFLRTLLTEDNEVRSDGGTVSVHFHPAPIKASDKVSVFNIIIIPSPVIKSQKNFYAVFADRQTSRPLLTPPLQPVHFRANTGKSNWEKPDSEVLKAGCSRFPHLVEIHFPLVPRGPLPYPGCKNALL